MGSVHVVPRPSPLTLPLPGFTGFRRGRFDHLPYINVKTIPITVTGSGSKDRAMWLSGR